MKVEFNDGVIAITNIKKESAELILESLIHFVNYTLKKKAAASMTEEEKAILRNDQRSALKMYQKIEQVYNDNKIRLIDTNVYDDELQRLN